MGEGGDIKGEKVFQEKKLMLTEIKKITNVTATATLFVCVADSLIIFVSVCLGATLQFFHSQWQRCWHLVPPKTTFPLGQCLQQGKEISQECRKFDVFCN